MSFQSLSEKISNKNAVVGILGLGYVGLPLAVDTSMAGFKVIGFDTQREKVDQVNRSCSYIDDIKDDQLSQVVQSQHLLATEDFSQIEQCDCILICVPTPLDRHQQPNTKYIESATEMIADYMRQGIIVILESTTYPGTTEEILKPILEKKNRKCGIDFLLAFSPERVDPGNSRYKTKNTPKVVGGCTQHATSIAALFYKSILDAEVYLVSSPAVAEMEKILENTYRNVNIGLINEFAILCKRMGISIWEVIDAAKTKPYGYQPFYPGPGLGGHCIPLDPYYLSWKAREFGFHTSMIEASMIINDRMPEYCVERVLHFMDRNKKTLCGSKVLVLGISYKQDIADYRESPSIRVIEELKKHGASVTYYDPYVKEFTDNGTSMISEPLLTRELLKSVDIVIITTAHTDIDYEFIQQNANMIFDTRNAMKSITNRSNVELL